MKINIGAGTSSQYEDYITIDYDPKSNPTHCLNLETDTLPLKDNSVDLVIAHHILEHLGEGYFHCLQELYRVCKPGATIDIRVPHPRHDTYLADPTHRRPVTPMGLSLFSKKYNKHCEELGAASSRLGEFFDVDFEIVEWSYIPEEKYKEKFKNTPREEVEDYISERNNIVLEIHIVLVVVKE